MNKKDRTNKKNKKLPIYKKHILYIILLLLISTLIVHQLKPLPQGISFASEIYDINEDQLTYLQDITYFVEDQRITEHTIFNEVFSMIQESQDFILIDMFLFNEDFAQEKLQNSSLVRRNITAQLTKELVNKKLENPQIEIIVITDGINDFYGSFTPKHFQQLKKYNISIIKTDVDKLRDSNTIYSPFYRVFLQWFGIGENGSIAHPLGNDQHNVTLRSSLKLLNFKANHRKLIITNNNEGYSALITSANPHTPSNLHSNIALRIDNSPIIVDMMKNEFQIAKFSTTPENNSNIITSFKKNINITKKYFDTKKTSLNNNLTNSSIQFLTEKKIKTAIIQDIENTQEGDVIELSMFYLSSRDLINQLLLADKRGVEINIILDPNVDAFGHEKNGIPNRVVASELLKESNISIRWYNTKGEQFHSKQITIYKSETNTTLVHLGSANYTRRNLDNFNLEANVRVELSSDSALSNKISREFSKIWNNKNDIKYTLGAKAYADDSLLKYVWYRFQEMTGLGTF